MKLELKQKTLSECRVVVRGAVSRAKPGFSEPLWQLIGAPGRRRILIDLAQADLIDASGVHWLVACWQQARASGGELVIVAMSARVRAVLQTLGLAERMCEAVDSAGL